MRAIRRSIPFGVVAALLSSILCASAASEITESDYSYREQVEPVCREMSKEIEKARGEVGDLKFYPPARASTALKRIGQDLSKGFRQLRAIESPSVERAQIREWQLFLKGAAQRYSQAGRALNSGRAARARGLMATVEVPSAVVATEDAQGFSACKFDPRRWVVPIRVPVH